MIVYIIIFIFNIFVARTIERNYENVKKRCLPVFALLFVNTLFVGFRDFGVGIDTEVYIKLYWQYANKVHSMKELFVDDRDIHDPGFLALACFSRLLGNTPQSFLLVIALFIFSVFCLSIKELKSIFDFKLHIYTSLFCFSSLYLLSLNVMRQMCAVSLCTVGFAFFMKKKYALYASLQLLAYLFHSTSLIFIIVPLVVICVNNVNNRKILLLFFGGTLGILFLFTRYFYDLMFYIASNSDSVVTDIYANRYGEQSEYNSGESFELMGVRELLSVIVIGYAIFRGYKKSLINHNDTYIMAMLFIIIITFQYVISSMVMYSGRLSIYFNTIFLIYFSTLLSRFQKANERKFVILSILFGYVINCLFNYIKYEWDGVIPYSSKILFI